jgi:hypothetical protein
MVPHRRGRPHPPPKTLFPEKHLTNAAQTGLVLARGKRRGADRHDQPAMPPATPAKDAFPRKTLNQRRTNGTFTRKREKPRGRPPRRNRRCPPRPPPKTLLPEKHLTNAAHAGLVTKRTSTRFQAKSRVAVLVLFCSPADGGRATPAPAPPTAGPHRDRPNHLNQRRAVGTCKKKKN